MILLCYQGSSLNSFPQPPTFHSLPVFIHGLINSFFTERMEVIRQELSKHHLALKHTPSVPTARFISSTLPSHGLGEKGISLFTFSPLFLNAAPSGILSLQCLPCFSYYGLFSLAQFWVSTPSHFWVPAIPEGAQFSNALISLQSLYPSLIFLFPCHPSLQLTILVLSCSSKAVLPPGLPQSSGAQPLSSAPYFRLGGSGLVACLSHFTMTSFEQGLPFISPSPVAHSGVVVGGHQYDTQYQFHELFPHALTSGGYNAWL